MLVTVVIQPHPDGGFLATAPDLRGCSLVDHDEGNAFARIRLAMESFLADELLSGQALPQVAPVDSWKNHRQYAGGRFYEVHMNLRHLEAVARHQKGR